MQNINTPLILVSLAILGGISLFVLKTNKNAHKQTIKQEKITVTQVNLEQKKQSKSNQQEKKQTNQATQKKKAKKAKKKTNKQSNQNNESKIKTQKQIQEIYADFYYGNINLKPQANSMHGPVSIAYKNSKILVSTTKNQLILYDLKKWKKQNPQSLEKYFVSLDNNTASAVCISKKYYFATLTFDKTIVYYEFIGQKGQYFRQKKKFHRNILKSDCSSIYVPDQQRYIVTSGSQADTTINIWSMTGQKLHSLNTYQIQHYDIKYSLQTIMVRGWTSQVKLFEIQNDKNGGFLKIQKSYHLAMQDQPISSSIDNLGLYGLTVSKTYVTVLWDLNPKNPAKMQLKIIEPYEIQLDQIQISLIHTLKNENQRYKTLIILAGKDKIIICDKEFNIHQVLSGIQCKSLEIIGSVKNVVLITRNKSEKLYVWNLTKLVQQKIQEYKI